MDIPIEILSKNNDAAGNIIMEIRINKQDLEEASEREREKFEKMFSPIPEGPNYIRSDK